MMIQKNQNTLKYVSLITLTLQNAALALSMRHARSRRPAEELFISSTAVVMAEIVKLITCLVLVFHEEGKNSDKFVDALRRTIIKNPIDTIKICVPSLIYVIQNNLLYVSASNLDAATNQVSYQLKILTTAMFAVIILRKKLIWSQWASLLILIAGVALVQLTDDKAEKKVTNEQNRLLGFSAVLGACILSGFAGIFFEMMLKGAEISVWMRNVQMSLLSLPMATVTCFITEYSTISTKGFFHGYDAFVIYTIVLNAGGGLIVAMVVKYADNILKGFATSLAIIISCVASIYLFGFQLSVQFALGTALVIGSIFAYGYQPKSKQAVKTSMPNLNEIEPEETDKKRELEPLEKSRSFDKV